MAESHQFAFIASVQKVQTLADGGIRVAFNLPETAITEAALLMECQRAHIALEVVCKTGGKQDGRKMAKRDERQSSWASQEKTDLDQDPGIGWQCEGTITGWEPNTAQEIDG